MQELKPVAKLRVIKAPTKHTYKVELTPDEVEMLEAGDYPLYIIPATHRIVPVELLEELVDITLTHSWYETAEELRAIIETKP
jgi:hypothetical protein